MNDDRLDDIPHSRSGISNPFGKCTDIVMLELDTGLANTVKAVFGGYVNAVGSGV